MLLLVSSIVVWLTEATKDYVDSEPKSALHRRIPRQLEETKQLHDYCKENHPKKPHTQTNSNNIHPTETSHTNDQTPENEDVHLQTQNNSETQDYDDPEIAKKIIHRNKKIIKDITAYTQEEAVHQEINKINQQIQHLTQVLNNLTKLTIAGENANQTKESNLPTPEPTDKNRETIHHENFNDFTGTQPHKETEDPQTSNLNVSINTISPTEFKEMEAKLHHRCKDRFEQGTITTKPH